MATIKAYTDLEQSKKLAEILPIESADMYWWYSGRRYYIEAIDDGDFNEKGDIRAWSLAALIEILPEIIHIKDWENYIICIGKDSICYKRKEDVLSQTILHESRGTNLVDACYEMILKLNKLNLL